MRTMWRAWLCVAVIAGTAIAAPRVASVMHAVDGSKAPVHLIADGRGTARLLLTPATGATAASLTELTLAPGAQVPEHVHETSTEILYVQQGTAEFSVDGKTFKAAQGDAVYIPAGSKHSAKVTGRLQPLRAVQVYVGPGPEQRFTKGARVAAD